MKTSRKAEDKLSPDPRIWLARAVEAEKQIEAARKQARLAKARFKQARKALKQAKRAAKAARRVAKVAARAIGSKRRKPSRVSRTAAPRRRAAVRKSGPAPVANDSAPKSALNLPEPGPPTASA